MSSRLLLQHDYDAMKKYSLSLYHSFILLVYLFLSCKVNKFKCVKLTSIYQYRSTKLNTRDAQYISIFFILSQLFK